MEFIPEWAPNIHPMIVHFPIALFMLAIIMDVVGYVLPEDWWDEKKNLILYGLSGIAAVGTYFSGKEAADSVFIEAETQNLLTAHADWAEYTVWFMGLYALLRIGVYFWNKSETKIIRIGLTLLSFVGAFLLFQTGDRGAQMVYQYGVGVQAVDLENPVQHDHETDHDEASEDADELDESEEHSHDEGMEEHSETSEESHDEDSMESSTAFKTTENGNWEWNIDKNAISDLKSNFHWLTGSLEEVNAETVQTNNGNYVLSFSGDNLNGFFVGHESYKDIQVDYYLNLSALNGTVTLANHVQDKENYDFVSINSDGTVKQGRLVNGEEEIFEEGTTDVSKSMFVRVVGNGTHFRGYINKEMVVHGHGDAPKAGSVGFKVEGNGTVLLEKMDLTQL
ncbi:MAG: DUF2231 domain-containing protein [Balneola sp.]